LLALHSFSDYINTNPFNKNLSRIWLDKLGFAQQAVEDISGVITRLEINNRDYDKTLNTLGTYSKFLDKDIDSLAKDSDLAEGSNAGTVAHGVTFGLVGKKKTDNESKRQDLIKKTTALVTYLDNFQNIITQRCDAPDTAAINNIDVPPDLPIDGSDEPVDTTNIDNSWLPAYLQSHNLTGSCSVNSNGASVTTTPSLDTLTDLDQPAVAALSTDTGTTMADIYLVQDGRVADWQIMCTPNKNSTSTTTTET
jgi:hypothetical protein